MEPEYQKTKSMAFGEFISDFPPSCSHHSLPIQSQCVIALGLLSASEMGTMFTLGFC